MKKSKSKKIKPYKKHVAYSVLAIALFVFAVTGIKLNIFSHAAAAVAPAGTYVWVTMPTGNLTSISHDVTINNVPNLGNSSYFWSHQFYFMGGPAGQGAYIGIQGINRAVFSVFDWDDTTETSPNCNEQSAGFDGGTEPGTSCIISYTVTQGHTYQLEVTYVSQNSSGYNWKGTVEDLTTGQTATIATINVPVSWGYISNSSVVWTEDFGAAITACNQLPFSDVTFSNFTGTNSQNKNMTPSSHSDSISQTACTSYSQINDRGSNSFTMVMGVKPQQPKNNSRK